METVYVSLDTSGQFHEHRRIGQAQVIWDGLIDDVELAFDDISFTDRKQIGNDERKNSKCHRSMWLEAGWAKNSHLSSPGKLPGATNASPWPTETIKYNVMQWVHEYPSNDQVP